MLSLAFLLFAPSVASGLEFARIPSGTICKYKRYIDTRVGGRINPDPSKRASNYADCTKLCEQTEGCAAIAFANEKGLRHSSSYEKCNIYFECYERQNPASWAKMFDYYRVVQPPKPTYIDELPIIPDMDKVERIPSGNICKYPTGMHRDTLKNGHPNPDPAIRASNKEDCLKLCFNSESLYGHKCAAMSFANEKGLRYSSTYEKCNIYFVCHEVSSTAHWATKFDYYRITAGRVKSLYRISNADITSWRPGVKSLELFSDSDCTERLAIEKSMVKLSGQHKPNGIAALLDGNAGTAWRPQCHDCKKGAAYIQVGFTQDTDVKCAKADNLGKGSGGGKYWHGGITLESSTDGGASWTVVAPAMEGKNMVAVRPPPPPLPPIVSLYRISNAAFTGWRPGVKSLELFSDSDCTERVAVDTSLVTVSGKSPYPNAGGLEALFDKNPRTSWRPQCHPCKKGAAYIQVGFAQDTDVKCAKADNLGKGAGGGKFWKGGITLESSTDGGASWTVIAPAMEGKNMVAVRPPPAAVETPEQTPEVDRCDIPSLAAKHPDTPTVCDWQSAGECRAQCTHSGVKYTLYKLQSV